MTDCSKKPKFKLNDYAIFAVALLHIGSSLVLIWGHLMSIPFVCYYTEGKETNMCAFVIVGLGFIYKDF